LKSSACKNGRFKAERDPRSHSSSEEVTLNWSNRIRQTHRWLSIIFTMTVVANFIARVFGEPPSWVVYSPLPPLFLLLFTGLYMFVLPYAARRRGEVSQLPGQRI
jgi:hypothetical protein